MNEIDKIYVDGLLDKLTDMGVNIHLSYTNEQGTRGVVVFDGKHLSSTEMDYSDLAMVVQGIYYAKLINL